ncbi:MAG: molybdopterin molybdotransferase MoeA, partial [Methylobacteriaceae bacterium]|nr:molybdopterin molybdotransferase MoeA [Methylobacteriaceae bacterium]
MTLLHPDEALQRILASAQTLSETETVPLASARGRVLAKPLTARCTLPPFDVSAMDGYACVVDTPDRRTPMRLKVIGESAAGHPFMGEPGHGEAVRVMTGAAVPRTANTIVLREQAEEDGARVVLHPPFEPGRHIRRKGLDFERGAPLLHPGVPLDARHIGLAAAMGHARLAVLRRPKVAIIATGDELLEPGAPAGDGARVFSSNPSWAAAMISGAAGEALIIGTAGDSVASLTAALDAARDSRADIILTCGGVSAGARDL